MSFPRREPSAKEIAEVQKADEFKTSNDSDEKVKKPINSLFFDALNFTFSWQSQPASLNVSPRNVLRIFDYWKVYCSFLAVSCVTTYVSNYDKAYGQRYIQVGKTAIISAKVFVAQ